jgi:hypothetical protein
VVIYKAFVEGKLEVLRQLARTVHDLCSEPKCKEFNPQTIWSCRPKLVLRKMMSGLKMIARHPSHSSQHPSHSSGGGVYQN